MRKVARTFHVPRFDQANFFARLRWCFEILWMAMPATKSQPVEPEVTSLGKLFRCVARRVWWISERCGIRPWAAAFLERCAFGEFFTFTASRSQQVAEHIRFEFGSKLVLGGIRCLDFVTHSFFILRNRNIYALLTLPDQPEWSVEFNVFCRGDV